jgi:hypothetical protein
MRDIAEIRPLGPSSSSAPAAVQWLDGRDWPFISTSGHGVALVRRKANDSYRVSARWESVRNPPRGGFFCCDFAMRESLWLMEGRRSGAA